MPGGDGTGPWGTGGRCTPLWMSGQIPRPSGMGFRGGFGRGRGFRNVYWATGLPFWARAQAGVAPMQSLEMTKEQELQMLENQADILDQQLKEIKKRIEELKK
ncbi:MAG: hypothetical protein A7316_02485 [Candidatus Altiarchaeales archaeon WOR_SM1_86-2]|nr:MAG: hypothetical protein A7316_02485 [Candidatus Altiarchaeales archaeon WOR_SM1_86-2]ODS40259.1 MAG: hypothetical protein A7315_09115 [Candidatus Altiarchaeales archaeon WOR_SM1_79]